MKAVLALLLVTFCARITVHYSTYNYSSHGQYLQNGQQNSKHPWKNNYWNNGRPGNQNKPMGNKWTPHHPQKPNYGHNKPHGKPSQTYPQGYPYQKKQSTKKPYYKPWKPYQGKPQDKPGQTYPQDNPNNQAHKPSQEGQASQIYQLTQSEKDIIVQTHNDFRAKVASGGVERQPGGYIPPLKWEDTLEKHAVKYITSRIKQTHNCPTGHNPHSCWYHDSTVEALGENIAWGPQDVKVRVNNWADEHSDYTYAKFPAGARYSGAMFGHYSQVVWAKTTMIGCAAALNCKGKPRSDGVRPYYDFILICNYATAGNMQGEYPYEKTKPTPKPASADGSISFDSCEAKEFQNGNGPYDPWTHKFKPGKQPLFENQN